VISTLRPVSKAGVHRRVQHTLGQLGRFPHASLAEFSAGLAAGAGSENAHAARNQSLHIGLGRLVGPHDPVHGGREHNGRFGGQTQGGEQVIRPAAGQAGNEVGAGRCDQHQARPAGQFDVAHGGLRGASHKSLRVGRPDTA
jgi:hypothetical protein